MDEEDFKKKLTPEQYRVMREKGEEKAFTGKYWDNKDDGVYGCAACGKEIFSSEDKFDSGSGFPSFKKALDLKEIELIEDPANPNRMELRCKNCASHLGFAIDGEEKYYQLNSASLELEVNDKDEEEDEEKESEKKSDRTGKIKSVAKNMAMLAATAAVSVALGATAGVIICKNSTPTPVPTTAPATAGKPAAAPSPVVSTRPVPPPAGGPTPAPTLPTSSGVGTVPPRSTPPPTPPVEPASVPPTEPPLPSSDGTIP